MFATLLLLASAAALPAQVPQCPADLGAGSVKVQPAPGWTGVAPSPLLLSGAGVVIGRPDVEPRVELRGSMRQPGNRVTETTYSGLYGQEKFLICSYGRGGELEQARPLPPDAAQCVVRVTRNQMNDVTVNLACAGLTSSK